MAGSSHSMAQPRLRRLVWAFAGWRGMVGVWPAGARLRVAVAGHDAASFARVPDSGDVTLEVHLPHDRMRLDRFLSERLSELCGTAPIGQRPIPERGDLGVQVGADPRDLALGDPGVGTERLDQVVDLPGRDTVQVGLHDHREQRLVDAAPALEQRGEERPGP